MPSSKEGSLGGHSKSANAGKEQNTVHDDAIWRQVIRYELDWSRNWQQKWGFMKESNEKDFIMKEAVADQNVSNIPSRRKHLLKEDAFDFTKPAAVSDANGTTPEFTDKVDPEDMKAFYVLAHNIRKLQLATGYPADKYTFPATRNNDIGWWTVEASKRMQQQEKQAGGKQKQLFDRNNLNTLLDGKLFKGKGRVANITKNGQ